MINQIFNPIFPGNEYIPDGEPHVFGDRVYLYGSHDRFNGGQFCLEDYTVWSAPVDDLTDWKNHGISYKKSQDPYTGADGFMQAPDCVQGADGRFYLYYALALKPFVSVAVSDKPEGPFEYYGVVKYPNGVFAGMREHDVFMFDPAVLRDDDGKIYLYCGFYPDPVKEPYFTEAVKKYCMDGCYAYTLDEDMLTIVHEHGKIYGSDFFEAASIRKFNNRYYFIYSSKAKHELKWAVSDSPVSDFIGNGVLVSNGDIGISEKRLNYTGNNHGSVECIGGKYYVFYHRQTNKDNYSRQACAEPIRFENGVFEQAEITSCGLNGRPLVGTGTYPARIACNLWSRDGAVQYETVETPGIEEHPYFTQTAEGVQYIANMREGATAVFKYFEILPDKKIVANHTGSGEMEIRVGSGVITFVYHGNDAADFYSFSFESKADLIGRDIQNKVHESMGRRLPANSFESEAKCEKKAWFKSYIKINDLQYASVYPNSFLDLYLPVDCGEKVPILLYAHGGGFLFCGKDSGDAYANGTELDSDDKDNGFHGLVKQMLEMGVAVASMEYALAPEYRFPVQIEQMDQAIDFIKTIADTYALDLSSLILMGSSAGADMVEIYATAVGNEEYAHILGLSQMAVTMEEIKGVIIDESALTKDAPKEVNANVLDQIWFGTENLDECQDKKVSFVPDYIKSFPPSFINCSTEEVWFYDSTTSLYQLLKERGIETEFFMPKEGIYKHGYMMEYAADQMAEECLQKVKAFIKKHL